MASVDQNIKPRVTAIVGAGAAMEIAGMNNHHSTAAITAAVLDSSRPHRSSDEHFAAHIEVANAIFDHLVREYNNRNSKPLSHDDALNQFHFEIIYHIIETLYAYDYYWSGTSKDEKNRPAIVDFVQSKLNLSWNELGLAQKSYITTIMDVVNEYDQAFAGDINNANNVWYKNWWQQAPFLWDAFTLNYDTTIENSLGEYEDGYEPIPDYDFMRFNPQRLLQATKHTINHLHGCIVYGLNGYNSPNTNKDADKYNHKDLYKHPSYDQALKCWFERGVGDAKYQSKESELFSPILTGLRKTDKFLHLPLDVYRWNLERKIMQNNALVIAGYSYGDTYVNDVINRMRLYHGDNMRVVLIDHKLSAAPSRVESGRNDRQAALGRALCTSFPQAGCEMILRSMNVGFYQECQFAQYKNNRPIISENGQFMCCYKGFKDAVTNHSQEIYDFLMR